MGTSRKKYRGYRCWRWRNSKVASSKVDGFSQLLSCAYFLSYKKKRSSKSVSRVCTSHALSRHPHSFAYASRNRGCESRFVSRCPSSVGSMTPDSFPTKSHNRSLCLQATFNVRKTGITISCLIEMCDIIKSHTLTRLIPNLMR